MKLPEHLDNLVQPAPEPESQRAAIEKETKTIGETLSHILASMPERLPENERAHFKKVTPSSSVQMGGECGWSR